jgi:glyoxylase-like metal-dependent hydrolase (beta-lactamase superfamily II)
LKILPNIHQIRFPIIENVWGSCYVLDGQVPTIVDTGFPDTPTIHILPYLARISLSTDKFQKILITHPHFDHAGGGSRLKNKLPSATTLAHQMAIPLLLSPGEQAKRVIQRYPEHHPYQGLSYEQVAKELPESVSIDTGLIAGDEIPLGDHVWTVLHTPGHNDSLISLFGSRDGLMLVSDTLQGDGTVDGIAIYEDLTAYLDSIDRIESCRPSTLIVSHPFKPFYKAVYREAEIADFLVVCRQTTSTYTRLLCDMLAAYHQPVTLQTLVSNVRSHFKCSGDQFYTAMTIQAHLDWLYINGGVEKIETSSGIRWSAVPKATHHEMIVRGGKSTDGLRS